MTGMLLAKLADYAIAERTSQLAPDVIHHAKRAFVDWYAAAIAGSILPAVNALEVALGDELGHGRSALAWAQPATIRAAAFINGAASHAAEVDDVFRDAVFHPGSPCVSAALSVGQAVGISGEELLRAVIVGYEISTRLAVAVFDHHYKYWHITGTIGTLGAAAAAGTVLRLDHRQFMHALATAATFSAGLQQAFRSDSMSKPYHAGRAAEGGATSALAAKAGATGALDVLEGPCGFGAAMGGSPDWLRSLTGLGEHYNITQMTTKNHCCCGQAFVSIDAALAARAAPGFDHRHIERVQISTYQTAIDVAGSALARSPTEAQFSIPYLVAHALVHGSVRLAAFEPTALRDEAVSRLKDRIELVPDERFNAVFPRKRCARIEVFQANGNAIAHLQETRKGDPEDPLTDADLTSKCVELTTPVIGNAAATLAGRALWSVDKCRRVDVRTWPGPIQSALDGKTGRVST